MKSHEIKRLLRRYITIFQNFLCRFKQDLNPTPLFILGNQKSGTTVIAGLLAEVSKMTVALDLPGLNEPVISEIYEKDLSFDNVVKKYLYRDFCKKIIKEPLLTFLYETKIKKHYSESNYIFIIRHPLHNIRSQLNWIKISGKAQILDLKNKNLTPDRLRVFNNANLSIDESHLIKNLALRWNYCAQLYLNHQEDFVFVRYEDFVMNKKAYIENLAEKLDIEIKNDISDKVDFRFQPKGQSDIDLKDFFGDENYALIINICLPLMKKIGYIGEL